MKSEVVLGTHGLNARLLEELFFSSVVEGELVVVSVLLMVVGRFFYSCCYLLELGKILRRDLRT